MRILRIVVQGALEALILDKLLRPHLGKALRLVIETGGGAGPVSCARSFLADDKRVALVLNTGTLSFGKIRRLIARLEDLLSMMAFRDRWKIVLWRPEIEILFFYDLAILRQLVGRDATEEELTRAQFYPKQVLAELLGVQPTDLLPTLQQRLDSVDLHPLAAHPQIRALLEFHAPRKPETWLISP